MASDGEQKDVRTPRKKIPFRLTPEALTGLDALATRYNTTQTTLIEAMGVLGLTGQPMSWDDIVIEARRLDAERRSRRPTSDG